MYLFPRGFSKIFPGVRGRGWKKNPRGNPDRETPGLTPSTVVIHLSRYIDFLRIFDTIISLVFDGLEKARVLLEKFTLVVPRMTRLHLLFFLHVWPTNEV